MPKIKLDAANALAAYCEEGKKKTDWWDTHIRGLIMRVEGQSMAGAGINDGDLIVVNRAKQPQAGSIVVALVHGDRTLKRLRRMDGRFWLVPEAEDYPHIIVDEYVEIWGVVVGVARKVA